MKIKIDRTTPVLTQMAAVIEMPMPPYTIGKQDRRSLRLAEIDTNQIYLSLYLGIDGKCDGRDRMRYLKLNDPHRPKGERLIRLDAAVAIAVVKNGHRLPLTWGKEENRWVAESMYFDGTELKDGHGNLWVLRVYRNLEDNLWSCGIEFLALDSESPTAVIKY